MHCGGCDNIPFWRWLKGNHPFTTSITCNDFDGEHLPNVQLNNVTDCFGEYLSTWFWKCYHIYRMYIENIDLFFYEEKFEDTEGVIKSIISKDRHHNGQKKKHKQRSTKRYAENKRSSNTNITKNRGWTQVLRTGKQVLLHMWNPSNYYCYTHGGKSWMKKGKWKWYIPIHEATFMFLKLPFHILSYRHG